MPLGSLLKAPFINLTRWALLCLSAAATGWQPTCTWPPCVPLLKAAATAVAAAAAAAWERRCRREGVDGAQTGTWARHPPLRYDKPQPRRGGADGSSACGRFSALVGCMRPGSERGIKRAQKRWRVKVPKQKGLLCVSAGWGELTCIKDCCWPGVGNLSPRMRGVRGMLGCASTRRARGAGAVYSYMDSQESASGSGFQAGRSIFISGALDIDHHAALVTKAAMARQVGLYEQVRVRCLWAEVALRRGGIHHLERALGIVLALADDEIQGRMAAGGGDCDVLCMWASFDGGWAGGRGCLLWEPPPALQAGCGGAPHGADMGGAGAGAEAGRAGEGPGEEALWNAAERAATTLLRELVRSHVAQRNAQGDAYKALFRAALSGHLQSPPLRHRRLLAVLRDLHAQIPHRSRGLESDDVDADGQD